jgi:hypothetical protein
VRRYSRPGSELTKRFPLIVEAMARLPSSCTIDGEAVACDVGGLPSFDLLRHRQQRPSSAGTSIASACDAQEQHQLGACLVQTEDREPIPVPRCYDRQDIRLDGGNPEPFILPSRRPYRDIPNFVGVLPNSAI